MESEIITSRVIITGILSIPAVCLSDDGRKGTVQQISKTDRILISRSADYSVKFFSNFELAS